MYLRFALFILLIQLSWTQSFGQQSNDTTRCYGVTDLRKIALKLIEGQQCDTLLKISELQISNRDSLIALKNKEIAGYQTESSLKQSLLFIKEQKIQTITLENEKLTGKLKRTKTGWLLTTCLLLFAVGYTSVK